jgi:exonuclease SbcC
MQPRRLILRNFGPFSSLKYDFVNESIAIIGENRTQDDQLSNGSGKSSISQGLFYGIYGVNLRGVLDKKLIREGEDSAYICVQIHCPIRKQILSIEREIRTKGSSTLKLELIDEDESKLTPVTCATVNDGNKFIANWIEISAEDAKSYYIVSKGNYKSFFNSSNTEKLALISRFINFASIDKTKDIITERLDELNEVKRGYENEKSSFEGKLSAYEEQLNFILEEDLEKKRNDEISGLTYIINVYDDNIKEKQNSISNFEKSKIAKERQKEDIAKLRKSVEKELEELEDNSFQDTYKEIDEDLSLYKKQKEDEESKLNKSTQRVRSIKKTIDSIEMKLAGVITCPNCHHEFLLKNDESVDDLKTEKKLSESALKEETQKKSLIDKSIEELDSIIDEYLSLKKETQAEEKKIIDQQISIRNKLKTLSSQYYEIDESIVRIESDINKLKEQITDNEQLKVHKLKLIDELKTTPLKKKDTSHLEENIKNLEKEIENKDKEILQVNDKIFKIQQWTTRFKDFKMYLALEQLKNIQFSANDILKRMGSDLRIMIEGFKKGANGKVKDEITPYVFRNEMESFFYYSGGEQARCEIALILALQTMINTTKQYGGMNFLFIDEVLESADSLGVENIISSISFLKQPILVVTHVPKLNEEIRQLKVIKENGISRLEV